MFVSRYPFTAKFPQSLSFAANDHFLGLRKENEHWLYAFHQDGKLGAVPTNYVERSNLKMTGDVCQMIELAIAAISDKDIFEKEIIINYLQELKEVLVSGHRKAHFPNLPVRKETRQYVQSIDCRSHSTAKVSEKVDEETVKPTARPPGVSFLMVDKLRSSTLTSFDRCVEGFVKMLKVLSGTDSRYITLSNELISELLDPNPAVRRSTYVKTEDWKGLQDHITLLDRRALDYQESSWPLVEDDITVISDLSEFVQLLCNVDPDMVSTCLSDDRLPLALSYLYEREKKALIRRFYLLVVIATCHLQPAVWPVYLDSGLPMEIIREIRSSYIEELDLILDLRVLAVLLTKSNNLPVNLQNELDKSFFDCVFTTVSQSLTNNTNSANNKPSLTDTVSKLDISGTQGNGDVKRPPTLLLDTFVQFVCAANRHFCVVQSTGTPIIDAILGNHIATRDLIERLLYIFNRDYDPLSLDGVLFVRRLLDTLNEGLDSSQIFSGRKLDEESEMDLLAKSRRHSSTQNSTGGDAISIGEINGSDEHVTGMQGRVAHGSTPNKNLHHRTGLTDATLQLAPDTPRNAARKLLADIFSNREAASLIYRNNVEVVIDVIIRQICDLPASSPNLSEFLFCLGQVIHNTDYMARSNGPYRLDDLFEALHGVEFSADTSSALNSRDFNTTRSLRLTNDLLTLLNAMTN